MTDTSVVRALLARAKAGSLSVRAHGPLEPFSSEGALDLAEFEARVEGMRVWCRSVERLLVENKPPELRVHAGFERLSRVERVAARYRRLAATADSLHLYGAPDVEPSIPGATIVPLHSGPLLHEWFLVVRARGFGVVIAAEDLDGFGGATRLAERRFRGFVSHHPALVAEAVERLDAFAGAVPGR